MVNSSFDWFSSITCPNSGWAQVTFQTEPWWLLKLEVFTQFPASSSSQIYIKLRVSIMQNIKASRGNRNGNQLGLNLCLHAPTIFASGLNFKPDWIKNEFVQIHMLLSGAYGPGLENQSRVNPWFIHSGLRYRIEPYIVLSYTLFWCLLIMSQLFSFLAY